MIKIDMELEHIRLKLCQAIRARKIGREAVDNNNIAGVSFAFGWLDEILDELKMALPKEVTEDITGNETNKP